jgi:hypothetical protein
MEIPKLIKVRQYFSKEKLEDIERAVRQEMERVGAAIKPNAKIAITVGSRGIANIATITRAVVRGVKNLGGEPFVVPAMGSHGGATAAGQVEILHAYGVTEEFVEAPIRSSMQVVELPGEGLPCRVYMDKLAAEADGTIVMNRIKVHTDFHGSLESGVFKMLVIGLGNHTQATEIHRYGVYGLKKLIPIVARQVLRHGNIIMGLGIVENSYDETLLVKAMRPEAIEQEEMQLLKIAKKVLPGLPTDAVDVLIVDRIGKDISGTGLDTNIIGRIGIDTEQDPERPKIKRIVITDLTEASHGNSVGMGLADIMTERLQSKIDFHTTYENVLTATFVQRGKMPIVAKDDRTALEYALRTCGPVKPEEVRIIRIRDTLHLGEIYVSRTVYEEIRNRSNIEVCGDYIDIFDDDGELIAI